MRRSQRQLGWLLVGVIVLAALALWQWRNAHVDATLLTIAPGAVTRIDVTRAQQPAQHYVKRDGHWYRAGTPATRVNASGLEALAQLAATPVLQWRQQSDVDMAKIGLATPLVVIRLNGHTLAYGALAAFGPQRFVRVGSRIAVIPASYSPVSPAPAPAPAPAPEAAPASAASSQKS